MKLSRLTSALVACAILATATPPVRAQDTTPMDHAALAASYDQDAKDAQQKAAAHELMLGRYQNMPMLPKGSAVNKEQMVKHCQSLVDSYKSTAKQATDLASAHRSMAAAQ
jgi:hypothetical protein